MLIKKPTQAEKAMFEKYGFIEVEDNMVELEHAIVFDTLTETVTLNNSFDFMYIDVIRDRMKELNFH